MKRILLSIITIACCVAASADIQKTDFDAIVVGMDEGKIYDDCHTFSPPIEEGETTIAIVTFDEETVIMKVINGEETAYSLDTEKPLETFFACTFTLKANQDPDHPENYYSTFFTNEWAYKLPKDKSVTAYAGIVDDEKLKMTNIGDTIHKGEPVVLKATNSNIVLMPSARQQKGSTPNILEGTDIEKTLGANKYALSLGQNGVGFYLWSGKKIGANKAYLTLDSDAKVLTFEFEDDPSRIEAYPESTHKDNDLIYNLNGIRVDDNYKGIVIKNGKKIYQK